MCKARVVFAGAGMQGVQRGGDPYFSLMAGLNVTPSRLSCSKRRRSRRVAVSFFSASPRDMSETLRLRSALEAGLMAGAKVHSASRVRRALVCASCEKGGRVGLFAAGGGGGGGG